MKRRTKRGQVIMWNKLLKATGAGIRIREKDLPGINRALQEKTSCQAGQRKL